jgi:hypothetical protein
MDSTVSDLNSNESHSQKTSIAAGRAFGAASTLVAQMGILLGMIVSQQAQSALVVASAASAVSGSFGDAFSMFISESTAKREAFTAASSVLFSKLGIGAIYVLLFFLVGKNHPLTLVLAITLTLTLLYILSLQMVEEGESNWPTFTNFVILTILVVSVTSGFGFFIRRAL